MKPLLWSYGVTTCPARREDLLPRTLASLAAAGFDRPQLFVDGITHHEACAWEVAFDLEVTTRWPRVRAFGNWLLALWELYFREPNAARYAIFQDDIVCVRSLRAYLDHCTYPALGYWSLYTCPENEAHHPKGTNGQPLPGWKPSNQRGKGALALVFDRPTVQRLLSHPHIVNKPVDPHRGWRTIDGAVVQALADRYGPPAGSKEYTHWPSLVQHTGLKSSMGRPEGDPVFPLSLSFPGEHFDALELLAGATCSATR